MLNHSPRRGKQVTVDQRSVSIARASISFGSLAPLLRSIARSNCEGKSSPVRYPTATAVEFRIFIRQALDCCPHLLWRCFKLATINHLQKLKRSDVFRQPLHLLVGFDLIQNCCYFPCHSSFFFSLKNRIIYFYSKSGECGEYGGCGVAIARLPVTSTARCAAAACFDPKISKTSGQKPPFIKANLAETIPPVFFGSLKIIPTPFPPPPLI